MNKKQFREYWLAHYDEAEHLKFQYSCMDHMRSGVISSDVATGIYASTKPRPPQNYITNFSLWRKYADGLKEYEDWLMLRHGGEYEAFLSQPDPAMSIPDVRG